MASLCRADVDVVVNIEAAEALALEPVQSLPSFVDLSSMDNSDLFVAMCLPGTFSPDHEGICHDCVKCQANQYERLACIPTRDRACANCTVCGTHDIELCQCSVKTDQCVTGDRVCVKVPPTVINLVVDFTSNGVLSNKQQTFVRSGLAVGYTDWLAIQFDVDPETVELTDFVRTGSITYKAYFRFNEVYGEAKIRRIQSQDEEFFQGGIYYTFGGSGGRRRRLLQAGAGGVGGRRRLLQAGSGLISTSGVSVDCQVNTTCVEPFTQWQYSNGTSCTGGCFPVPCPPGYSGAARECQLCLPGTFKNASGFGDCQQCPAGYTSPTGSNSSDECTLTTTTTTAVAPETTSSSPPAAYSATTTTAALWTSTSSVAPPSTSAPVSQQATALAISSSSAGPQAPSITSSAQPAATSLASSAKPAATSLSYSQQPGAASTPLGQTPTPTPPSPSPPAPSTSGPPPAPPPPGPPPTTSSSSTGGTTGGTGSSSNTNTNTNNNVNTNNNNNNINIQLPPSQPSQAPVFNNYIRIQQLPVQVPPPPPPSMSDRNYGKHHHYYDSDYAYYYEDDWVFVLLLLFAFVTTAVFCVTVGNGGCPSNCCGCDYCWRYGNGGGGYSSDASRPVIRYNIVPSQDPLAGPRQT